MKKIVLFLLLILSINAEDINKILGYESSYDSAIAKAKKEHKQVMLVIVTDYCPWCRKMENFTLKKASVAKLVHKDYVAVILDRADKKFPKKFDTPRIPTIFFIDANSENAYWESIGYKNKNDFTLSLKEATKIYIKKETK